MKNLLVAAVLLSTVFSLNCNTGEDYVKIVKKTTDYGNEESFKILSGTSALYSSPTFADSALRTMEACIPASSNHIYTLQMKDKANDSWSNGAYIEIYGINDNIVYKAMMVEKSTETDHFALYAPIGIDASWKYTSSASGNWKDASYDASTWTDITLGSTTQTASGTEYFRKTFVGINGMAAIDLQLKYKSGVVAYINGVEVFRDNMPTGEVTPSTPSSGSYATVTYHGVIRSASVAQASSSVLAVELHFTDSELAVIEFNALLAFLAGVSTSNNCVVVPTTTSVTGNGFSTVTNTNNWSRSTGSASSRKPATITYEFTETSIPMIDAFRIWTYSNSYNTVTDFTIEGATSTTGTYSAIMVSSDRDYAGYAWEQFDRVSGAERFKAIRLTARASHSTSMHLNELQFMVCNRPATTTIAFQETSYSYYRNRDSAYIAPKMFGYSSCTVSPSLPSGMTLNPDTCIITGVPTTVATTNNYQVTANVQGQTYQGSISLTVEDCTGTLYKIERTYKSDPDTESFRIRNSVNDDILFEVQAGHSHSADKNWIHYVCISVERFDVAFYSTSTNWYQGSFFYMYYLLPDNQEEMIMKGRYDNPNGSLQTRYLYRPSIEQSSNWYYKTGSVPANWYNSETSGWQTGSKGSFAASTNKVQLYKQTFTISSFENVMGVSLSIRYKYGCVVYLNGHEAWRNGVTGEVGTGATVSNIYSSLIYHVVTLPAKSMAIGSTPSVQYLNAGANTIAIAILAQTDSQTESYFDAVVRLMPAISESHIWEFTYTSTGLSGEVGAFDMYFGTYLYGTQCNTNYVSLTLKNDRREWISSLQVQAYYNGLTQQASKFNLLARNSGSEPWTVLANVTGLSYTVEGQKKRIYLNNNTPYNQFRFENFGTGVSGSCQWKVQSLDLFMDNMNVESTPLVYPETITAIKNIEMAEVIPEGEGYRLYEITPALPEGISLDPYTGWITGMGLVDSPETTYTITATRINGSAATAIVRLTVGPCAGQQSLMTVRIRADQYAGENTWSLYEGRGNTGRVIDSVHPFPVQNTYYYLDFCLANAIYTFEAQDSYGDGWQPAAGYTLMVDVGEFELDIQEVPGRPRKPVIVSTVFSSFLPFQVQYSEWKVFQGELVDADWNKPSYDDNSWATYKAADIPNTEFVTTYIRKSFQLTNVDDYQVLNIRMKYTGGVAVYFNGKLFGRFNLAKSFDAITESIGSHDVTAFTKFHVILATAGVQEGANVVAFEVHRPVGVSSSEPVVFDATGVFGVDDCSAVIDTYSGVTSSMSDFNVESLLDLNPYTISSLPNSVSTYLEWTVENLEGSRWNTYNILGSSNVNGLGFDLIGYMDNQNKTEPITTTFMDYQLWNRTKSLTPVPVALIGFVKTRFAIVSTGSTTTNVGSMFTSYCKATGNVCPAVGEYPAVSAGQISPAPCPEYYDGYSYRECDGTQLGEVKDDRCLMKVPANIHYSRSRQQFVKGVTMTTGIPRYDNIIEKWYVDPMTPLPAGISINELTGEISGIATSPSDDVDVVVYGENKRGVASTTIAISVRIGVCKAEGVFPITEVDQVAVYQCSMQGSYIGSQKRACVLGVEDGEWQKASGYCMPVVTVVLIIVVVIAIIVAVILILIRRSKKTKSVAGGKGKSGKSSQSKTVKTAKSKNVKI